MDRETGGPGIGVVKRDLPFQPGPGPADGALEGQDAFADLGQEGGLPDGDVIEEEVVGVQGGVKNDRSSEGPR